MNRLPRANLKDNFYKFTSYMGCVNLTVISVEAINLLRNLGMNFIFVYFINV